MKKGTVGAGIGLEEETGSQAQIVVNFKPGYTRLTECCMWRSVFFWYHSGRNREKEGTQQVHHIATSKILPNTGDISSVPLGFMRQARWGETIIAETNVSVVLTPAFSEVGE